MSHFIVIDSLDELVTYVEEHLMTEEIRTMFVDMKEFRSIDFHFGFALSVRNQFVLDDPDQVPQLIEDYMNFIDPPDDNFVNSNEEEQHFFKQFLKSIFLNPDGVSYAVCKILWDRLHIIL